MNRYGQIAWKHWEKHLPDRLEQISDPQTYFTDLGQQAAEEIDELAASLEHQHAQEEPPGDSFLMRAGQLGNARMTAESTVLRRLLPDPTEFEDPQTPSG